jgi:3-deoxy-D-manno-octulosonic-acid transferase
MFSFVYFCIATILYILAIPFLIILSFKQKYSQSIPSRFILFKNPSFKNEGIWFHVASLGEVKSLRPLILKIGAEVNISTITQTGFEEAGKITKNSRYLPYELLLPFWIKKQKALVVSEAELWYFLFLFAKRRGAKTYLINARISDNSYKNYKRFSWLYKKIFSNIDMIFAQSQKDSERLAELGGKHIVVNGNINSFSEIKVTKKFDKPKEELITLASTHKNEEILILENLNFTKGQKLVVVPRHPERFDKVDTLLREYSKKSNFTYHKFSEQEDLNSDIVLIDKMGELINIYAISDRVILGGSFVDGIGGHNPLEPAHFGCKVVSGEYVFNQYELFKLVENLEIVKIEEINDIMHKLKGTKIISSADIDPIIKELNNDRKSI